MIVNKKSIYVTSLIIDFFLINISFIASYLISQSFQMSDPSEHPYILIVIINFVWFFYTNSSEFYEEFLIRPFPIQIYNIFKLTLVISVFNVFALFLIKQQLFTRNLIVINGILVFLTISIRSIIFKATLRALRSKGKSIRNLLIIGANKIGERFKEVITKNPEYGHRFVGFINNEKSDDVVGTYE